MDIEALHERGRERIEELGATLGVRDAVVETAGAIFTRVYTEETQQGRSLATVAAAALYVACKQEGAPVTSSAIADAADIEHSHLLRRSKWVQTEIGTPVDTFNPKPFVDEYANTLGLSDETRELARNVVTVATEEGVASGKSPSGFAAAAIYYAAKLRDETCTQDDVHEASGVSKITIRNRYQEQAEVVGDVTR
ncbi:transcription initiation factor IIB family protein [Natranaeroarchaeum aerophilus]|uniref:Transcription initiation factor IIB n=1 Tax=Natranaeroarchaeum aerophilus TaxID=2917711 RepID=A0AAE3FUI7_9EURY|nr:transcription initiation factor IIB family protein [Natranaeroarchaeum aerophilus]MCL9815208.1 transcription initiation factor IIB family protein [Natranaeroarchaeum aerophilus]